MLTDELEKLRECLNQMIVSEEYTYEEILKVSQEIDCLIVQYLKESMAG